MAKVIVERPRHGGGVRYPRGSHRGLRRVALEDAPRREAMKRRWSGTNFEKGLNENLAPLRRYLLSNVGRPWNKVFSEMSQHLRLDSAVQLHVWQHVQSDVCFDAVRVGREYVNSRGKPVRWHQFVVDVRTGLLRRNPLYCYARTVYAHSPRKPPAPFEKLIKIDETRQYGQIDGIWYLLTLAPMPPANERANLRDVVLQQPLGELNSRSSYYAAKRQLNTKEIRRLPAAA